MRGTSPLLVPLIGVALLGEKLTVGGWIGVLSIVAGIVLLSDPKFKRHEPSSTIAPLLALAAGICIAGYIAADKVALRYVSPVVLNEVTSAGNLLALTWAAFHGGRRSGWQ
jgi:drug/metabolite transporter (DMT)-like permease